MQSHILFSLPHSCSLSPLSLSLCHLIKNLMLTCRVLLMLSETNEWNPMNTRNLQNLLPFSASACLPPLRQTARWVLSTSYSAFPLAHLQYSTCFEAKVQSYLCINTWIITWKQINMICLIPTCLWRIEPVQTPITSYAMFSPSLSKSSHSTSPWHLLASSSKVCFIACLSFGLMLSMPGDIRKQHQVLQNNG